ncbi:hypothetical protein ACFSTI_08890 [Rhizorhabdus histidinilytica]
MQLVFLHGPVAAGKLTVARLVAERTGIALFHNHLVVDAVAAVFPFGSPDSSGCVSISGSRRSPRRRARADR